MTLFTPYLKKEERKYYIYNNNRFIHPLSEKKGV